MHHPSDRIAHTVAFLTPVVDHWLEREISQWIHYEGSIRSRQDESQGMVHVFQGRRDVEESFGFHPTLVLSFLK